MMLIYLTSGAFALLNLMIFASYGIIIFIKYFPLLGGISAHGQGSSLTPTLPRRGRENNAGRYGD
jgi:hypothetical protein